MSTESSHKVGRTMGDNAFRDFRLSLFVFLPLSLRKYILPIGIGNKE